MGFFFYDEVFAGFPAIEDLKIALSLFLVNVFFL